LDKNTAAVCIAAISAAIGISGLCTGHDGVLAGGCVAVVASLGGYVFGRGGTDTVTEE
jgi:hypothetical protein